MLGQTTLQCTFLPMHIKQKLLRIVFWCCVVTILILSCLPGPGNRYFAIQNIDKLAHFATFFVLSILLLFAYNFKNPYMWTAILMAFFGMVIEVLHLYIPNRVFSISDFVADVCGIIAAFAVYKLLSTRLSMA